MIGIGVLVVLGGTMLWTVHQKSVVQSGGGGDEKKKTSQSAVTPEKAFVIPSKSSFIPGEETAPHPKDTGNGNSTQLDSISTPTAPVVAAINPYEEDWRIYEQEKREIATFRTHALRMAVTDPPGVEFHSSSSNGANSSAGVSVPGSGPAEALNSARQSDYLDKSRTAARARYEVKAGTVIPGTLITGVNSDVAGEIIGQVREAVYDSATAEKILIPQGSKLIGTYNSHVEYGQDRVQVAWNRIIFPDQSSIDLAAMSGADMSGESGFQDQTDNHLFKIFGNAILASAFGSAAMLSQNIHQNNNNVNQGINPQQVVASQLGLQVSEVGMEMVRRGLNIPPTIEIRPGYEFNIMANKDMILPPYHDIYGNGETRKFTEEFAQ
jgi:type IV secretion system protein VirB10